MSDTNNPGSDIVTTDSTEEPADGALTEILESIETGITGLPAPIRKNFWKAFGQLCTAAVDVPVAMLEGIAAEKRAETKARVKLIARSSDQLAEQMKVDPDYVRAAAHKFTQKVVREQVNLDKTTAHAYKELANRPATEEPVEDISSDFLNAFEKEASQMSSEHMQELFGKLLAGEIRKPSSFSIKSVRVLAQMDNTAAVLFQTLCSMTCSLQMPEAGVRDVRVVAVKGAAGSNGLQEFGLGFDQLNILFEYGLIISDYNSYMSFALAVQDETPPFMPITYGGKTYVLRSKERKTRVEHINHRVYGVALTTSGRELLSLVTATPPPAYTAALVAYFDAAGYVLERADFVYTSVQEANGGTTVSSRIQRPTND